MVAYWKAARPADLEDIPLVSGTGCHLPKRKLMYGHMVIDIEAGRVLSRYPLLGLHPARNVHKAESLAIAFSVPLPSSVRVAPKANVISLSEKEARIREANRAFLFALPFALWQRLVS